MRNICFSDSPSRKRINEAILKLQEMGVLLRLKDKWWKEMNGGGQCKVSNYFHLSHRQTPISSIV